MRRQDKMPPRNKKNFRSTKSGAGMTKAGVARYRRENPGSKLKTAVTGKVKPGSKAANRRKSYCARSAGQMKKFPKRKFNAKALIKSLEDKNAPMKKARLDDSIRGKKMVFKKSGGRIGLKAGSTGCKLAMKGKGKAYGKNS